MNVCTCDGDDVDLKTTHAGAKYCHRCGHWWMPAHGSLRPGEHHRDAAELLGGTERNRPHRLKRNDPCSCGSGLKYKQCHGAPQGGRQAL